MNRQSPLYIVFFILLVSLVFGFGISFVNYATLDTLKKNESMFKNRVITEAFMLSPGGNRAEDYSSVVSSKLESFSLQYAGEKIEMLKNRDNGDLGLFFSGRGFWDTIKGIMVLSPDLKEIRNLRFLEQKETPGLGARIEEGWFTDQFKGLAVPWENPPGSRITLKTASESRPGSIDAVTGATQTSLAVAKIINDNLEKLRAAYKGDK